MIAGFKSFYINSLRIAVKFSLRHLDLDNIIRTSMTDAADIPESMPLKPRRIPMPPAGVPRPQICAVRHEHPLAAWRRRNDITLMEASTRLRITKQAIINWEQGHTDVSWRSMKRIAALMRISVEEFARRVLAWERLEAETMAEEMAREGEE